MKKIITTVRDFLNLASTKNITAHQPENQRKPSLAEMNRRDIKNDLIDCLTLTQVKRLKTVLALCVSNFDPDEFQQFLESVLAREALLELIDEAFGTVPPRFSYMMVEIPCAGFDELQILMLYCKQHQRRFHPLEWQEIEIQYHNRMERLASMRQIPQA